MMAVGAQLESLHRVFKCRAPSHCTSSVSGSGFQVVCKRKDRGERESLPYHVTVITPPQRHLGIHSLPPNTQCGETVTVKGEPYIVSGVTYRYQLRKGKYEASQKRLDVQSTGRYILNMYLDNLLHQ